MQMSTGIDENIYQDRIHLLTYITIRNIIHIPRKGIRGQKE